MFWRKSRHLLVRPSTGKTVHKPKFCQIKKHVCFYLLYHPWNVVNVIFNTLYIYIYIYIYIYHQSVQPKGRYFTAKAGTKVAVLSKCRFSTANSGTKVAVLGLLGMNRCCGFPLLSASHSLFSIWTDLKRSEKIPGTPSWMWGEWIWITGSSGPPKFTRGVKYQFHQGFWPDQRSGNPNWDHLSDRHYTCHKSPKININQINKVFFTSILIKKHGFE